MSIVIKKVEISNIQAHKYFVFTPNAEGITAIRGANGTGKSTIVDSIAWALYGTKPPGVAKAINLYNEEASFPDDKCFVKLFLKVDGRDILVERKMLDKNGKTECNVVEEFINDDGETEQKHQAGPAVSHAETYIRKLLRMDEKGFLTAILIQQKEVDKLISASARERAGVIEKLTGISSITEALKEAKQEFNTINRMVKAADFDEKKLEQDIAEKKKLDITYKQHMSKKTKLEENLKKSSEEYKNLSAQVEEEYAKIQANEENKTTLGELKARIDVGEETLAEKVAEKDEKKKNLSLIATGADFADTETKLSEVREKLSDRNFVKKEINQSRSQSTEQLDEYKKLIEKSSIKTLEAATTKKEETEKRIKEFTEELSLNNENIVSWNTEIKKLDRAIKVLSDKDGTCPTCLQHVDHVEVAVASLNSEKEKLQETVEETLAKNEKLETNQDKAEGMVKKLEIIITAVTETSELEEKLIELNATEEENDAAIVVLEAELKSLTKIYDELKQHEDKKREYDKLVEQVKRTVQLIDSLKGKMNSITEEIKKSGVITDTALERLRKKANDAQEKYTSEALELKETTGEVNLVEEQLRNLSTMITSQQEEMKSYQELLNKNEIAKATVKVIEEFKEDRIKSSVPILESYASDLINRFTEGKFTGIRMNSKFNTTVVLANGKTRAVGSLSGGELSLTSIALLVSISMLLNGADSRNPIILDEVFVSQDSNRADLSISTIKEVCKGQVIMIAHNESLDSVADKVVELQ